ncbi:helix-turn-helix domain-containing protein [Deinococcus peraridilitoris]|uniref:Putative transcriptional regulator n=1 Tax=Deinococcus peraridilitoris (strain DSM 19664 / LMG 22246 / CIP 109416 / KR-200) TaxID=937777 RepID=K9ZZX4_DEIPD|nr:helix-turn-helix transcriptional regulator [Deinococcus peraridilitoris]AFZ67178.1 putative transcriptional regulator [Deinococcus peraridilitoris DSM 19664]
MLDSTFGQRLRQFRVERNKSMREAAREADISVTYLSKLESDEGNPTLDVLIKLANLYGVTLEDLTAGLTGEHSTVNLDVALARFINEYGEKFPELHDRDWQNMLNGIRLRGRRPEEPDDWLTIFVDLRRALAAKQS